MATASIRTQTWKATQQPSFGERMVREASDSLIFLRYQGRYGRMIWFRKREVVSQTVMEYWILALRWRVWWQRAHMIWPLATVFVLLLPFALASIGVAFVGCHQLWCSSMKFSCCMVCDANWVSSLLALLNQWIP